MIFRHFFIRDHRKIVPKNLVCKINEEMSGICHSLSAGKKRKEGKNLAFFICLLFDQCTFFSIGRTNVIIVAEGNDSSRRSSI